MVKTFFALLFSMFICNCNKTTPSIPKYSELSPTAKNELNEIISLVFEKDKVGYNFNENDKISQITIGKPFSVYMIGEKRIAELKSCTTIKETVDKKYLNREVFSILFVRNKPTCLVEYCKQNDGLHVGEICSSDLNHIQRYNCVLKKSSKPIIFSSYIQGTWYFTDQNDGYSVINLLSNVSLTSLGKTKGNGKSIDSMLSEIEILSRRN